MTIGTGSTAGVLQVTGNSTIGSSGSGSLTVSGGTAPSLLSLVSGAPNTLTINSATAGANVLTLGGSSGTVTLNMEVGSTADEIALGSGLTATVGAGGVTVNIAGLGSLSGTQQVLIADPTLTGTFTLGALTGNFTNGGTAYNVNLALTGSGLVLNETPAASGNAFYTGTGGSVWSTGSGANFVTTYGGATASTAAPGGAATNVFIASSTAASTTTTLGQNLSINSLSFTGTGAASTNQFTLGADGHTLTLAAANSFTDQNSTNYLAGTGLVVQSGSNAQTIGANILLGTSQTWQISNAATNALTVSGSIGDAGFGFGLTKTGVGTLTLTGNNTYTGGTTFAGGMLNVGSLGALNSTGNLTFTGGTLQYSANNTADYSSRIVNSTASMNIDTNFQNITFGSVLAASNSGWLDEIRGRHADLGCGQSLHGPDVRRRRYAATHRQQRFNQQSRRRHLRLNRPSWGAERSAVFWPWATPRPPSIRPSQV